MAGVAPSLPAAAAWTREVGPRRGRGPGLQGPRGLEEGGAEGPSEGCRLTAAGASASTRLSLVFGPRTSGSGSAPRTPASSQLCVHFVKAQPASEPPWTPLHNALPCPLSPSSPHLPLSHRWAAGLRSSSQAGPSGRPWTCICILGATALRHSGRCPGPPALAQSQGASPAGEEGKYPFVCSFGLCSRVSGDKSQVGRGAWRLSRLPRPEGRTGTHRCGGREPAEGPEPAEGLELRQPWPWSCPAALLPPPLDPPGSHLLQEASRMWLPSCLPPLASEPLQWACDGGAAFET